MASQPLAFAELAAGGVLFLAGISGDSIGSVVKGTFTWPPKPLIGGDTSSGGGGGSGISTLVPGTGGGLSNLPEKTALTGSAATDWATSILKSIGAPVTNANLQSMVNWFGREGGGGANNPLNTTLSNTPGAAGAINSAGVQNYSTPQNGVTATASTLQSYPSILADLKKGIGLSTGDPGVSSELWTWSGHGYTSV